ncbi:hypothetical protein [Streptomyces sp. NRRL S-350]|uniref:hypothetical protein n=1 Tax=Streptomyces sp. NRRL S-350 TaxID=1463902 RepID=UPI0004C29485|nr:hypothetical protein [Streptomyces sp. NRRL S-350]
MRTTTPAAAAIIRHTIPRSAVGRPGIREMVEAVLESYAIDTAAVYLSQGEVWFDGKSDSSGEQYVSGADLRAELYACLVAPYNVIEQEEGSSTITVRWTLPSKKNGQMTRRRIYTKVSTPILDVDTDATYKIETVAFRKERHVEPEQVGTIAGADLAELVDAQFPADFQQLKVAPGTITLGYARAAQYGIPVDKFWQLVYTRISA